MSTPRELRLCRELVVPPFAGEGLAGLAAVTARRGELQRAARLAGAANSHRYGQPKDSVHARLDAAFFEPARTRCGPDAWDAAVCDGFALNFMDAIAYALEGPLARRPNHASNPQAPAYPSR